MLPCSHLDPNPGIWMEMRKTKKVWVSNWIRYTLRVYENSALFRWYCGLSSLICYSDHVRKRIYKPFYSTGLREQQSLKLRIFCSKREPLWNMNCKNVRWIIGHCSTDNQFEEWWIGFNSICCRFYSANFCVSE
jgi:hypothetical protein